MMRRRRRLVAALSTAAFLAIGVVAAPNAYAASLQWTGSLGGSWNTGGNWSPAGPPANNDVLTFPASAATLAMQNDIGALTPLALNFLGSGYTISGNALAPTSITQAATGTNQIFVPISETVTSPITNLPVAISSGTLALNQSVQGGFGLTKTGAGTLVLAGANNYTGNTVVGAGVVLVNGSNNATQTQVSGGTLGGSGQTGAVTATSGGIAPGEAGAGLLTVNGALSLQAGVTVTMDILGAQPGTLHDALRVSGGVVLNSASLVLTGNFFGPTNQQYVIIDNTSGGPISGTFVGLPEGQVFTAGNGISYRITYVGGTGGNDVVLTQVGKAVTVLSGADRIDTAVAVSKNEFPTAGSANAVVLARADAFPDALAGTPLAVAKGGPLLLTGTSALDPRTQSEIQRVLTSGKTVYILGLDAAISPTVATQLQSLGYTVQRFGGQDRFETAVVIASNGLGNPTTILLATGLNFPDALSGGAAAAKANAAILLTNGNVQAPATSTYLSARPGATLIALGGPAAVAVPTAQSIVGVDRYDTSVKVAQRFFTNPANVGLASGVNFPDGLTGGTHIGKLGGPLMLTDPSALPAFISSYLQSIQASITAGFVYGGTSAVSTNAVNQFKVAIGA